MIYWLSKVLIGPWLWLLFRPKVRGREYLPSSGPVIFASNHLSVIDSVFLPLVVSRKITFLAKSEYFTTPGIKGFFMRFIFKGLGQVSIDRSSGSAAQAALTAGARVLQEGKWLGIYPEGTRSPDGRLYRGKTGVARLVLETKAPVIPVAMVNTEKILPIGASFPRIKRAGICFGKPLNFSRYEGFTGDRLVERAITDEITAAIRDMSKQEYVDVYASAVKTGKVRPRPVANKDME